MDLGFGLYGAQSEGHCTQRDKFRGNFILTGNNISSILTGMGMVDEKFSPQPSQCKGRFKGARTALVQMLSWNSISPRVLPLMENGTIDRNAPVLQSRTIARQSQGLPSLRGIVFKSESRVSFAASIWRAAERSKLRRYLL